MSQTEETTLTYHAMLVAWGQYARCIGLVKAIEAVPLHQKAVEHRPQHDGVVHSLWEKPRQLPRRGCHE